APPSVPGQSVKREKRALARGFSTGRGVTPRVSQIAIAAMTITHMRPAPIAVFDRCGGVVVAAGIALAPVSDSTSSPNARSRGDLYRVSGAFSETAQAVRLSAA